MPILTRTYRPTAVRSLFTAHSSQAEIHSIYAMVCTGADLEEMRVTEILCGGVDADVMVSVTCPNWESGDSDTYSLKNDCWFVPTLANIVELVEEYV